MDPIKEPLSANLYEQIWNADRYVIAFSGGKDSLALLLFLIDKGIDRGKIELWHHMVDGEGPAFVDWPVTVGYVQAVAKAFQVPIYLSWKEGGFKGELLRENSLTNPITFEDQDHRRVTVGGIRGNRSTRRKFPQVTADLKTRWCSSYLKIACSDAALINQERFRNSTTVILSGERAEESAARARYAEVELDRADGSTTRFKRTVIRYRPILRWPEADVWEIMCRYRVRPHPAYQLGYSRCSCAFCIFLNGDALATSMRVLPEQGKQVVDLEREFGVSIKRDKFIGDLLQTADPFPESSDLELVRLASSTEYDLPIIMKDNEPWVLPAGAFKRGCGGPQ